MNEAFRDFGIGLIIAILLVYLILMAQFRSFIDPFIILMSCDVRLIQEFSENTQMLKSQDKGKNQPSAGYQISAQISHLSPHDA